ncbi:MULTISPECIES: PadR family transcriptional regulator [Nocardiopsidaceae]|uniref:PadR family transcriptional regulator n=2 Tax=Nocardiopsidaceae TaxID=83676 RepID=A0ABY6YFL6_9ACTN|nr:MULTISPECIES: PadR family transcriptional regulator [Nocardiopsaceae]MEE2050144.1 PadR family transcriptional regulator [Nocardiopsis umidischolae]WAE71029.1 PadR family transcriptional regulator [Streptomonospora nanhaiensis]
MKLSEQSYLVLLALTEGPTHGYGIITSVRRLSEDKVKLGAGTLYGALDRLGDQGLVEAAGEEVVNGRNRRYYRLTGQGHAVLAAETERMARLADLAHRLLNPGPRPQPGGA